MIQIKRFDYTPILGWSATRFDTFSRCKRQYYYQYYGKYDKEFGKDRIEPLKKLTSIPLEIGSIVHDTVAAVLRRLLKSNKEINEERFKDFVKRKAEQACQNKRFFEVYYAQIEGIEPEDLLSDIDQYLVTFLKSHRFEWIRENALTSPNDWIIEPPGYGESRIETMKVYCKVDFLFKLADAFHILEWKTGKRDEKRHMKQLLGYSTWAAFHLGAPINDIEAILAYLKAPYDEVCIYPSHDDIEKFAEQVRLETEDMYHYCSDIDENIPRDKSEFPLISESVFCSYCNYKELCGRM